MFQWPTDTDPLLTANCESPPLRKSPGLLTRVYPEETRGHGAHWLWLRSTACLPGPGFKNAGSISRHSHDRLWLWLSVKFPGLDQIRWTKINSSQAKVWWWRPPLLVFPAVHISLGGTEERSKGATRSSEWVTAVSGPRRRCRLRPGKSARSLEGWPAESRLLLPVWRCLGRGCQEFSVRAR